MHNVDYKKKYIKYIVYFIQYKKKCKFKLKNKNEI